MKATTRSFLYIAIAWILIVFYSLFQVSVVESLLDFSKIAIAEGTWKQIVIFLYGLAVVSFLGGSQVPAVFLKKKSFVVQFTFSAMFGLVLLLITMFSENVLGRFNQAALKPFFTNHPVIALEYLSIPYLFMVFLDLYLSGRLGEFSWRHFPLFLSGTFLHPRRTYSEIISHPSVMFSFLSIVLVSVAWIARSVAFSTAFTPARWHFISLSIGESSDPISRIALILPAVLLTWLTVPILVHVTMRHNVGRGSYFDTLSLLGFAFLPSLITIAVDLLEFGLQAGNLLEPGPNVIFLFLGFVIPLVVWPLVLATLAIQTSGQLPLRSAGLTAGATFLPLFVLLVAAFL